MKRYLILCVLLIFLVPCMVVPASASSWTNSDVEDIIGSVQTIESDLYSWFEQWYNYFLEATETVYDVSGAEALVTPFKYDLIQVQMYILSWVDDMWIGDFYDYFFTTTETYTCYRINYSSTSGIVLGTVSLQGTGFQRDLDTIWSMMVYGLFQGFRTIRLAIVSVGDTLTNLANYFVVENQTITYSTSGFNSDGEFTISTAQKTVTGFIADIHAIFDRFYKLLSDFMFGDNQGAGELDENMTPVETQVNEWIEGMETAPTINVDDIETEVDKVTDFETDANYLSVLSGIFLNEAFLMMFTWCVIMAMLGFILYGKR